MPYTEGNKTFTAYHATILPSNRVVKLKAGAYDPPLVELCDAGEFGIGVTLHSANNGDPVTVKPWQSPGTFSIECLVAASIVRATALYVGANGVVTETALGTCVGYSLNVGADGQYLEVIPQGNISTTAAAVSITDAGSIITATDADGAIYEIFTGMKTAQYCLFPNVIKLETGADVGAFANGVTDGWTQLSNKSLAIRWNNGGTPTDMMFQFIMPQDLKDTAAVVLHLMGAIVKAGGAEVDSPTFTVEAYFDEVGAAPSADTDCGGTSGEFLTAATNTFQEKTLSIAHGDVPASPSVLTLVLHPTDGELGTDDFVLLTPWLEVTRSCLTS